MMVGAREKFLKLQWYRGAITEADLDEMMTASKKAEKLTKEKRDEIANSPQVVKKPQFSPSFYS